MWLPFLFGGRYIFFPGPQKKARGPGRLRADGKIPSRGQFEGTGSVQDLLTSASESSLRISWRVPDITSGETQATRRSVFPVAPDRQVLTCWSGKSGYCQTNSSGFLPHPLIFQCFTGGDTPHQRLVCQCIVGETSGDGSNKMYRFASS